MRLLIVLPITAQVHDGRSYVDSQACNGLRLWLKNFEVVTVACRAENRARLSSDVSSPVAPLDQIEGYDRLTFVPLPIAYTPYRFVVALPATARLLAQHIRSANYLHFSIGGLWGDWAAVACLLSGRRPYAVWTDRVEHKVVEFSATSKSGAKRLYTRLTARLMERYERLVIRRSALGLFHGADCFNAYARYCPNPHLVHDVHVSEQDLITSVGLERRLSQSGPLRIAYAGRVHREKGVFDWIEALASAAAHGVEFQATWFGDGPEIDKARQRVVALGLPQVSFPGALDHTSVLSKLRASDVFVFCHKTPESPRCLIEALQCGLPIVGYESDYPKDLIGANAGGILTPAHYPEAVAQSLAGLASDKSALRSLSERAMWDGAQFTDERVFLHRSGLMKRIPNQTAA